MNHMGVRESLNEKPWIVGSLVALLVLLAGVALFRSVRGSGEVIVNTQAYFSTDDGKTYFTDLASRSSPFKTSDGKLAIRANLFRCGGKDPFVGYLEREDGGGRVPVAAPAVPAAAGADAPPGGFAPGALGAKVVKRPGEKSWAPIISSDGLRIILVKCPDGQDADRVSAPE